MSQEYSVKKLLEDIAEEVDDIRGLVVVGFVGETDTRVVLGHTGCCAHDLVDASFTIHQEVLDSRVEDGGNVPPCRHRATRASVSSPARWKEGT